MIDAKSIEKLNRKYTDEGIDAKDLHENPFMQFKLWFDEIIDLFPIGANAMTLATSTLQGRCSARTVLLKYFDNKGFVFFTNYQSRKGQELSDNPYAALNFHCSFLQRDVRIEGIVAKVSREASIDYFYSRARESQLAALLSEQSETLESREELETQFMNLWKQYEGQEIPYADHWGGYLVEPRTIEFWQGRKNRLHDRILYERDGELWVKKRLAP
jgi:pyridoxamine 5'-phosphate oxidase